MSSSSSSSAVTPDEPTAAPEVIPTRRNVWRFIVEAVADDGTPFAHITSCPPGLSIPTAADPRVVLLPPACTFTDACARIADVVPSGDMWILQAPGFALALSQHQLDLVGGMFHESVLCLSAFQRDDEKGVWSAIQSLPVNHFVWIGLNSALLRGVRADGKIRDRFSCISFTYVLRQEKKLQLMNPCFSFLACRILVPPTAVQDDVSDAWADVVFDQKYDSDANPIKLYDFAIDVPVPDTIRVRRTMNDFGAIAWGIAATKAPPMPPCKLYLPLGPEGERARMHAEAVAQQKKLLMLPIYTFSRLLSNHVPNDVLGFLTTRIHNVGSPAGAAAAASAASAAGAAASVAPALAHMLSVPLFQRNVTIHFECDATPDAIDAVAAQAKSLGVAVTRIIGAGSADLWRSSPAIAGLGYSESVCTKEALGFKPHGSCQGEDMLVADLLAKKGCLVGGTYIDVGCGLNQFSNTTNLAMRAGWRGVCIDVLPDMVEHLRASRPGALALQAYVSRQDGESKTLCVPNQSDQRRFASAPEFEWKCKTGCTRNTVTSRSLASLLAEHAPQLLSSSHPVHYLNITCEGEDAHVLAGASLESIRPLVVSILFKNEESFKTESDLLASHGYTLHRKLAWVAIFERS